MTRVLLLHSAAIPHYRVPIYSALSDYLKARGFELIVASDCIQPDSPHPVNFRFEQVRLSTVNITRLLLKLEIEVVILFINMRHRYLFPTYFVAKGLLRRKMIYWGQGLNLANPRGLNRFAYKLEHALCNAIILYADPLKKYIAPRFREKVFVANNTLCFEQPTQPARPRQAVLAEYGIRTPKNIICIGRIQKRKRLEQLVAAHALMKRSDIGLILAGPDPEGLLAGFVGENIYKLGPVYDQRKLDLLAAADVYCLPGAVGLSIVDAFHCGLPLVTEEGDESAEMMYLKNGQNGFIVPRGDVAVLCEKLLLLLDNNNLRQEFSAAARKEIDENGHVSKLCAGFRDALCYATGQAESREPVLRTS